MKIKNLWAAAVAIFTLASCSSEPENVSTPQTEQATKQVYANLTMSQNDGDLRVLFDVPDTESGAISGLYLADGKDLNIRIAVKQGDNGTPVLQDLVFTRTSKNTATYSGQITVPNGEGDYKIGAVLLSEVGGKTFASYTGNQPFLVNASNGITLTTVNTSSQVDVNVPYVANWVNTSLNSTGTVLETTTLSFKPLGTLLRLRFKNNTSEEKKVESVMFTNSRFSNGMFVDFKETTLRANPFGRAELTLILPGQLTLAAQQTSDWYYAWVIAFEVNDATHPIMAFTRSSESASYDTKVLSTTQPLTEGKAMKVTLTLGNETVSDAVDASWYAWTAAAPSGTPRVSLDYLAEKVVNQTGDAFVTDYKTDNTSVGLFTQSQAITQFGSAVNIGGKSYSLPTASEVEAIIPPYHNINGILIYRIHFTTAGSFYNLAEKNIKIGDLTKNYLADYVNTSSGISYAVRFKDDKNYNRTAFRYQYVADAANNLTHLKITARYLGASSSATIAEVATESFWTSNNSADVERILPYYGCQRQVATSTEGINTEIRYWTRDNYNSHTAYILHSIAPVTGASVASAYAQTYCPVLLMER